MWLLCCRHRGRDRDSRDQAMVEGKGVEIEDKDKVIEDRVKVAADKLGAEVGGEVTAVIRGDIEVSSVANKEDIMKQCKILHSICTTIIRRAMQKDLKHDRIELCTNLDYRKKIFFSGTLDNLFFSDLRHSCREISKII